MGKRKIVNHYELLQMLTKQFRYIRPLSSTAERHHLQIKSSLFQKSY